MTDKPTRPKKPAANDVVIWELHDKGSDKVTRWLLSGGLGFTPKYCRTKKDFDKAQREAISHAKIKQVDVWSCALGFSWTLDCERVLAGGVSR